MVRKRLVYVVDSFSQRSLTEALRELGLSDHSEYWVTGAGGADMLMFGQIGERMVDAKELVVFMSTFHGNAEPAVRLSEKIKAANPNAKVYFRSVDVGCFENPVFDGYVKKDPRDHTEVVKIVKEALGL